MSVYDNIHCSAPENVSCSSVALQVLVLKFSVCPQIALKEF